jgi:putative tryptophan/tyrosine transport system substrate-binding protein
MASHIGRRKFITLLGGSAALWPVVGRAQQPGMPVIGYLNVASESMSRGSLASLRQGLADAGYVEGHNVAIELRWANLQLEKLREMAAELVQRKVAIIVAEGGVSAAFAAKAATSTIPIVIASGIDPVRYGLVASLNRPGGNITGVTFLYGELGGKRLGLLCELVPQATTIAYLAGPGSDDPRYEETSSLTAAAQALGRQFVTFKAVPNNERTIDTVFGELVRIQDVALMVGANSALEVYRAKILASAALNKIPASYPIPQFVFAGGLMSYSVARGIMRQVAVQYVAPILRGAKPADLPVQQPTRFELVINLKAAKTLGLTVPDSLLARADEVIE